MDSMQVFNDNDRFARGIGVELLEAGKDTARARLRLSPDHENCFGIAHAGAILTLADTAFGAAANSGGELSLAVNISCSFMRPGATGAALTADCRLVSSTRKVATYVVEVADERGKVVAHFQGLAYRKGESLGEALAKKKREGYSAQE